MRYIGLILTLLLMLAVGVYGLFLVFMYAIAPMGALYGVVAWGFVNLLGFDVAPSNDWLTGGIVGLVLVAMAIGAMEIWKKMR